jgi:hypothetical protein
VRGGSIQEVEERLSQGGIQEGSELILCRGMREAPGGGPAIGPSARTLGVRPDIDIPVDPSGSVHPGTGGMSVAPDTPRNLPQHRRPPEYGGTGRDPVWSIQGKDLGANLRYVPDDILTAIHGVIEPATIMTLAAYQRALEKTAPYWTRQ